MAFEIATVELANGARIGICPLPGRDGRFDADMAEIFGWRPDVVVSMTGSDEMRHGGATQLPERLEAAGIGWRHLPIVDFSGPAAAGRESWPKLARDLHAVLDAGGAVLTHCYGGHGRSGMVTMRLMVERGEEPEAALDRIRAVRPGAVEAESQKRWAAAGRKGPA